MENHSAELGGLAHEQNSSEDVVGEAQGVRGLPLSDYMIGNYPCRDSHMIVSADELIEIQYVKW